MADALPREPTRAQIAKDPHAALLEQVKSMEKAIKEGGGADKQEKLRQLMVMRIRIQGMADENRVRLTMVKKRNVNAVGKFCGLESDVRERHEGYGRLDCSTYDGSTTYADSTLTGSDSGWQETDEDRQTNLDSEFSDDWESRFSGSARSYGPTTSNGKSVDPGRRVSVQTAKVKAQQAAYVARLSKEKEREMQEAQWEAERAASRKSFDPGKRVSVLSARQKAEDLVQRQRDLRPRKSHDLGRRVSVESARAKAADQVRGREPQPEAESAELRMRTPSPECPNTLRELSFPFQASPALS